jgi:hypothetical protein
MGRSADRVDPVRLRLVRHRHRVLEITRTVVETRKDVAVEIDRDANPAIMARSRCRAHFYASGRHRFTDGVGRFQAYRPGSESTF